MGEHGANYRQGEDLCTSECKSSERFWCLFSIAISFTYYKLSSAQSDELTRNHCYHNQDTKTFLSPHSFLVRFVVRPSFSSWSWATRDPPFVALGIQTQLTPLTGGVDPWCVAHGPKLQWVLSAACLPPPPLVSPILLE